MITYESNTANNNRQDTHDKRKLKSKELLN